MIEVNEQRNNSAQILYEYLCAHTKASKTVCSKALMMNLPKGLDEDTARELLATIGTKESPEELISIAFFKGRKDIYYYDSRFMTQHFAEIDSMLQEKDILHTIAVVARSDSALYPIPTQFSKLMNYPFYFTEDELLGAAARFKLDSLYPDIDVVEASNGAKAFYSKKSLSRVYAQSLLERYEVLIPNFQI